MANTANQPWTGPTAKDAEAGGKTLKRLRYTNSPGTFSNGTEQARAAFKKLKVNSAVNVTNSPNVKGALKSKPHCG